MKKIISLLLAVLMLAAVFAGCGEETAQTGKASSPEELKTFGDILDLGIENTQKAYYENKVVFAFEMNGVLYRAIGSISEETFNAIINLDFEDEERDKKEADLVSDIKIEKLEDLSGKKLSADSLKALEGKTYGELQEDGWTYNGYSLEEMKAWLNYGPYSYVVFFNGKVEEEDYENFEWDENAKEFVVKSVEFDGVGDATNID